MIRNSLHILVITIILLISFFSCFTKKRIAKYATIQDIEKYVLPQRINTTENKNQQLKRKIFRCKKLSSYYYDPEQPYRHTQKTIRVNIHFINSLDSTINFNADKGIKFAKGFILQANNKLGDNKKMNLPENNETPLHPISYRYKLTPNPLIPGDEGIYFHYEKDPFFLTSGKNKNNYSKSIINKYAINNDTILNIFYMVHPTDSISSKTYKVKDGGIALGNSVKLGINFAKPVETWTYAGLLNHEIGHVLGLSHTWRGNDGCDDTPQNSNCWNKGKVPCDGIISNNVMDYNSLQTAFSPCQVAKTNKTLSKINSKKRPLAIKDWCFYNESNHIYIKDTVLWDRVMDLNGDITIEQNAQLTVSCHLNMAKSSKITVKSGGHLVLAKATIYNDCGYDWQGILIEGTKNNKGTISYIDTFHIQNTKSTKYSDLTTN